MTFAANAQLKYNRNGYLLLNVPDGTSYSLPAGTVPTVIMKGPCVFLGTEANSLQSYIRSSVNGLSIGPIPQGKICMRGAFSAGYHDVYLKSVFNQSDERAKTNIRPLGSATSTIMRLNPVTYQFINRSYDQYTKSVPGADGTETGFLAQEVARVLPNAVAIDEEDNYLVNYTSIIPVLVKAVQEQQAQIEALKAEIETLKKR